MEGRKHESEENSNADLPEESGLAICMVGDFHLSEVEKLQETCNGHDSTPGARVAQSHPDSWRYSVKIENFSMGVKRGRQRIPRELQ